MCSLSDGEMIVSHPGLCLYVKKMVLNEGRQQYVMKDNGIASVVNMVSTIIL